MESRSMQAWMEATLVALKAVLSVALESKQSESGCQCRVSTPSIGCGNMTERRPAGTVELVEIVDKISLFLAKSNSLDSEAFQRKEQGYAKTFACHIIIKSWDGQIISDSSPSSLTIYEVKEAVVNGGNMKVDNKMEYELVFEEDGTLETLRLSPNMTLGQLQDRSKSRPLVLLLRPISEDWAIHVLIAKHSRAVVVDSYFTVKKFVDTLLDLLNIPTNKRSDWLVALSFGPDYYLLRSDSNETLQPSDAELPWCFLQKREQILSESTKFTSLESFRHQFLSKQRAWTIGKKLSYFFTTTSQVRRNSTPDVEHGQRFEGKFRLKRDTNSASIKISNFIPYTRSRQTSRRSTSDDSSDESSTQTAEFTSGTTRPAEYLSIPLALAMKSKIMEKSRRPGLSGLTNDDQPKHRKTVSEQPKALLSHSSSKVSSQFSTTTLPRNVSKDYSKPDDCVYSTDEINHYAMNGVFRTESTTMSSSTVASKSSSRKHQKHGKKKPNSRSVFDKAEFESPPGHHNPPSQSRRYSEDLTAQLHHFQKARATGSGLQNQFTAQSNDQMDDELPSTISSVLSNKDLNSNPFRSSQISNKPLEHILGRPAQQNYPSKPVFRSPSVRVTVQDKCSDGPLPVNAPPYQSEYISSNSPQKNDLSLSALSLGQDDSPLEVLKFIAKGASGKVVLCKEKASGKLYAVKVAPKSSENAITELEIYEQATHPSIIGFHGCFQSEHFLFLLLDYAESEELYWIVAKNPPLGERKVCKFLHEIASAVQYIHTLGYIHRDIKLENILLTKDGRIKLTDFDQSVRANGASSPTVSLQGGTRVYFAPEVVQSSKFSFASDWWAVGIVFHEMLFQSHPFYTQDEVELFNNILHKVLDVSKEPVSLEAVSLMHGLLEKNPAKRIGGSGTSDVLKHPFFKFVSKKSFA